MGMIAGRSRRILEWRLVWLVVFACAACAAKTQSSEPWADDMQEALVVVGESESVSALPRIGELVQVKQQLPPRLAIVEGEARSFEAVRSLPGVVAVCEEAVPDTVLQQLNSTERLFAEAWVVGRKPKTERRGDGLPWDADGFEPPDRPPRR